MEMNGSHIKPVKKSLHAQDRHADICAYLRRSVSLGVRSFKVSPQGFCLDRRALGQPRPVPPFLFPLLAVEKVLQGGDSHTAHLPDQDTGGRQEMIVRGT